MRSEPFAVELYRRFLSGKTMAELSSELGIPIDRIESRIRAAAVFLEARQSAGFLEEWHVWA